MTDAFIYRLKDKINKNSITKIIIRKAMEVNSLAFECLFSEKLICLEYLNLDECIGIENVLLSFIS